MTEPLTRTFYRVSEVAARWGMSKDFVYDLINDGELKHTKFGQRKRIPVEEVAAYEQRMTG